MHNFTNVETVSGNVEDPCLPDNTLDIAFMINVYHHLDKPVELVRNIIPSLKSEGILAIVEHDTRKSGFPRSDSTPMEEMLKELNLAGFKVRRNGIKRSIPLCKNSTMITFHGIFIKSRPS